MPVEVVAAIAAAIVTGLIGAAVGWWFGRRRWDPQQSEIVLRLLATSSQVIETIEHGEDPEHSIAAYKAAFAEADVLLPRGMRTPAEHLFAELGLTRNVFRLHRLDKMGPTGSARLHAELERAKKTRADLRRAAKKHFGIPDGL